MSTESNDRTLGPGGTSSNGAPRPGADQARADRLADELAATREAMERLRLDLGRMTAERDSYAIEARRMTYEWNALADELKAARRRGDIAEGETLILGSRLHDLDSRLERSRASLNAQPLYRIMVRAGLLRPPVESPDGAARRT